MNLYLLLIFLPSVVCPGQTPESQTDVVEEKQCSVIQEFEPRCFALTKDLKPSRYAEITFKSQQSSYSTINRYSNLKVIEVGGPWTEVQPGEASDVYECIKDIQLDNYKDEQHRTKFKYHDHYYGNRDTLAESLFIVTRRELWTCQNPKKKQNVFDRVVTELLSKEAIGLIYHYHGTTFKKIRIPKEKDSDEQLYTAVIREIKYLNPETGRMIKIDGSLKFKPLKADLRHHYEVFKMLQLSHMRASKDNPLMRIKITAADANTILIDKQPLKEEVNDKVTICTEEEESQYAKLDHLPLWSTVLFEQTHQQSNRKITWDENNEIPIKGPKFLEYFIVTRHVIMVCTAGTTDEAIHRVDIEYVGKTVLKEAHVYYGKDVFSHRLKLDFSKKIDSENKGENSVAIRDVFYFKESDPNNFFRLNGKVDIRKFNPPPPPPKQGRLAWLLSLFPCIGRGK